MDTAKRKLYYFSVKGVWSEDVAEVFDSKGEIAVWLRL